jgi:hypothetical protein
VAAARGTFGPKIDRRHFLALAGALAAAACAPGPTESPRNGTTSPAPAPTPSPSGPPADTYDGMRRLQAIVRASPDHLATLAATAVASGDPEAVVTFVRDHIAVLAGSSAGADATTDARWGVRGTLASGRGTLRERADLLADLLGQQNVTASVMTMPRPATMALEAIPPVAFAPDRDALTTLWDAIDPSHPKLTDAPDDAPARADAAAAAVLAALPARLRTARAMAPGLPDRIPVVAYGEGSGARWATALGQDAPLARPPDGLVGASAVVMPQVVISVDVALNPPAGSTVDRAVLHEVLRGAWPADQLAARQLTLAFGAPGTGATVLQQDRRGIPVRQPLLRLEATDLEAATTGLVRGTAISLAGGLLEEAPDGSGAIIGPLGPVLSAPAPGPGASGVMSVTAAANPHAFPTVDLAVSAIDASGTSVDGLPASAFQVAEDGVPQAVTLVGNTASRDIRVLVVYDTSGSVTDYWSRTKQRSAFEAALASGLVSAATQHPFSVQVIGVGDAAREGAWLTPEVGAITSAFTSLPSTSDIWTTLGLSVPASGASAVILVSDNVSSDFPDQIPGLRTRLRASGVPVAVIPVGVIDEAATTAIVTESGGIRLDPTDKALATGLTTFISGRVATVASTGYRLRYVATASGPVKRSVTIAITGSTSAGATAEYDVPAEADRAAPSGVAGVYLTVRVGDRQMRRRLGGVQASDRDVPDDTSDAAAIAGATAALDAIHTIRFEPGSTTASLLDDLIGAILTFEPVELAWPGGPSAIAAAAPGWRRFPASLAAMSESVASPSGPEASPAGLQVLVLTETATDTNLVHLSDVVPKLDDWLGVGPDAEAAFRAAGRASVAASIREATTFPESAADQLDGLSLTAIPALDSIDAVSSLSEARRASLGPLARQYATFHRLVPTTGDIVAAWIVDPDTGSLTAVGADGRGAGKDYSKCLLPKDGGQLQAFITTSIAMISLLCLTAPDVMPPYACIGSDVYGAGTTALGSFTAPADIGAPAFAAASYAVQLAAGGIQGAAGRSIIAVLLLMSGLVAGGSCV